MVHAHEIPQGCRLYFGESARIKRQIEAQASGTFLENGFEEIVTPHFSYLHHLDVVEDKRLLRLQNDKNHLLALRPDSTLDIVRIITKRLGRSTSHKKWFYIQPIFCYPSCEFYQIGAELIGDENIGELLPLVVKIMNQIGILPVLQLSNIKIPLLLSELLEIDLDTFKGGNVEALLRRSEPWLPDLLYVKDAAQLQHAITQCPEALRDELRNLLEFGESVAYGRKVYAPLYYASMDYYEGMFFRMFEQNETLAMGGVYSGEEIHSCGFAIYTDPLVDIAAERQERT